MKQSKKGHQRSRLRVDPLKLTRLLCEQNTTLSAVQQRTGFDPAELDPLRTARKIHLDTLNRLAAGLKVPPNSLLIAPDSLYSKDETIYSIVIGGYKIASNIDINGYDKGDSEDDEESPLYL